MKSLLSFCAVLALALLTAQCAQPSSGANANDSDASTDGAYPASVVERGKYLVHAIGCDDCHTPKMMTANGPMPDPERHLMGHPADEKLPEITDKGMIAPGQWALFSSGLTAAVGPWGISFAANLTPDDTGTGAWTEAQFFKAIREGKSKGLDGTRPLLPPMPWPAYANLNDEDLRAIFAYLRTITPIKNAVPNPLPPLQ